MWKKLHRLHPFFAIKGGYQNLKSAKQNSPNNPVMATVCEEGIKGRSEDFFMIQHLLYRES